MKFVSPMAGLALGVCLAAVSAGAQEGPREIKHVFVIAMENHNWTQPNGNVGATSGIQQIYGNPACPFINSLVNGTAQTNIDGQLVNISQHVAYANAYHNVLATPSGNNPHIHPSEPNYLWAEAGTNFGVANDNDPYSPKGPTVQTTHQHLATLLAKAGHSWRSYQEDIDLQTNAGGNLVNVPLPRNQWTVPLSSHSGSFDPTSPLNEYNDTLQYNYAAKHNPMVFFTDTNGNGNPVSPDAQQYAPMQQLAFDLAHDRVADYNWITPDQYNDQHSGLKTGFAGLTGDAATLKAGDNALARLVPMIMASKAYKDGGAIVLWWDESENDGDPGDNGDDFNHTVPEIVISNLARANEGGMPYASTVDLTHSSDLKTWQEVFHVGPLLGDAATPGTNDLSDLFAPGVIPTHVGGDHGDH
ncbi:alkaline phosphatase family protein [Occallatibacter riparius]|uniref:Alkaline phosphatase family protein n=1 Tax=Occallatibacter riparius TaxID=1002689 RepID=A0A9J7BXE5_9BACT|nr:alkaline phosphatase family protein [Occallatibacter riparius]UWZ85813.1 alkaline phosphatase family protein [Occallatibacter riparius]